MPWRWGPPNGRHSCLGLICLTSLRWGVVCFLLLSTWRPRSCSILVVPLFLIAPPFYTIGGAIFFLPWLGHSIFELAITARFVSPYPRRSHLPVRASCGFWGFHMGPSPRACLPVPPCLIRLILTRHAAHDVIAHRPAHRLALRALIAPRPAFRHDGRGGVIASPAMPFVSARRDIIRHHFPSHCLPRLSMPINHGASPSIGSDCGEWLLRFSPIDSAIRPLRFVHARPAQSTRGTGRTTGRVACLMSLSRSRLVRLSLRLRLVWDGDGDCVYRMGAFNCLPAILRLPGNTSAAYAGRHGVGSRSGLIVSPPASYPMRLRILCPIAPSRLPRAVSSAPFPCLLRPHRPANRPNALPIHYPGTPLAVFPPLPLTAYHSPPAVSDEQGGFSKRIEFDAFEIGAMERFHPYCLLTVVRVPCRPSAHLIISSKTPRPPLLIAAPSHHGGRSANGAAAPITPRQSPRSSCRRTGRRMCFDVIGCHAVDTVIYDSRWRSPHRACPLLPIISFISSSHPIPFLALPPLPGSLLPAYLI